MQGCHCHSQKQLLWLSMLDFPLMLQVKLPVVDKTHPQSNKFSLGVKNKATGVSKRSDSPEDALLV